MTRTVVTRSRDTIYTCFFVARLSRTAYPNTSPPLPPQLPHWMNLTFAAAAKPRNRSRNGEPPTAHPAGLASTTPPNPQPPETQRPVTMPKLIWAEQLRWKPDGRIDVASLNVPFVLKRLLEWREDHPDIIDIAGPPDPEDEHLSDEDGLERRKAEANKWDEENTGGRAAGRYRLQKWHAVEHMFPQPPHGIEGAAQHARVLRNARKKLRKQVASAAAAVAAAAAGTGGAPPSTPGESSFLVERRHMRSPSGSVSSASGRIPPELVLGTSPASAGYVGSPRSFGRTLTLSQVSRPFPDRDNYVGVAPQPSLKRSPRAGGYQPWGGGGSSGSVSGIGEYGSGSGSGGSAYGLAPGTPVPAGAGEGGGGGGGVKAGESAAKRAERKQKKAAAKKAKSSWPEYERKTMDDEDFAEFLPKWEEYDKSVDRVRWIFPFSFGYVV